MHSWTDDEELSGRKAFDLWRFTEAPRAIPWDWADMADHEKQKWIERAVTRGPARRSAPRRRGAPERARRAS